MERMDNYGFQVAELKQYSTRNALPHHSSMRQLKNS